MPDELLLLDLTLVGEGASDNRTSRDDQCGLCG